MTDTRRVLFSSTIPADAPLVREIFRHVLFDDGNQFVGRLADLRGDGIEGRHHPVAFRRPEVDIGLRHAAAGLVIRLEGLLGAVERRHDGVMRSAAARLIAFAHD